MMPGRRHSFDTSALIDGLERFYPQQNFPTLWERVDDLIAEGRLLISEEVWREAIRVDSATKRWCEDRSAGRDRAVSRTDADIAAVVGDIMADYPHWSTQGSKNGADPFVIALAESQDMMVITGEKNGGPSKPKIPYVCRERDVPCGHFTEVIRAERWSF